ncbi:transglycosylase domain-containing protein [Terriglobus albidus]|uniref:transglycosylase domain-containing protein n=1 Tax=Terriglobus albidus TaxID=1592106 RepID=UPI0021E0AF33|nr:transglycosylase domain-containing protein [Terriglobus albidus]
MGYKLAAGPSGSIRFPDAGPYDLKYGYSNLPAYLNRLHGEHFNIEEQARVSSSFLLWTHLGAYPIYHEKSQAGLDIVDERGESLYSFRDPRRAYGDFTSIPPLVVQTLLFIENRHMLTDKEPDRNPAIEWDRLAHATFDFGLHKMDRHHSVIGGSTLATQLEKLRHSPAGRTHSPAEKLRQITSATLRSYQDGRQTLGAQRTVIRDYINSIPLSSTPEHGEVTGLADGLAVWYGANFDAVNRLLAASEDASAPQQMQERARAYRQVLSLFLALRKPSIYLAGNPDALAAQTDRYLRALCKAGVISSQLRDASLRERVSLTPPMHVRRAGDFVANKAANAVRAQLLGLLGIEKSYELDRLDLNVQTTIDQRVQQSVTRFFQQLANPENARRAGLDEDRLLSAGDPSQVIYSFTLYERGDGVNLLRAQSDNFNQPLSIVDGTRLQLGSTAKLRTLISYLQIIESLHGLYSALTPSQLAAVSVLPGDRLTEWALQYLSTAQDRTLKTMLEAALNRQYSGNPGEVFFTAGGRHVFANFERPENNRAFTVRDAFEQSVNLVFIRLMRDIEGYYKWRLPGVSPSILSDPQDPARQTYLKRFADQDGSVFLRRFYEKYRGLDTDQALEKLIKGIKPTPVRVAVIFRSTRPQADFFAFSAFMNRHVASSLLSNHKLEKLYADHARGKFNLSDCGYLAHVHPLELWLMAYLQQHPGTSLSQVIAQSAPERQEVYRWLFRAKMRHGQDVRISILLEQDAFHEIWRDWKRLGYPFDSLVPSYATSIGVSGDTPRALAELAGIIANGGIRYPEETIHQLTFAHNTPMETNLAFRAAGGEAVLSPVVAGLAHEAMLGVVRNGTGRRALRAFALPDGKYVPVAGKTGTGDNRFKTFAKGKDVVSERAVNRTAAFVFIIGDRLFGTVMAFVPGESASSYKFTSALAVQILKDLAPTLQPLISDHPGVKRPALSEKSLPVTLNNAGDALIGRVPKRPVSS